MINDKKWMRKLENRKIGGTGGGFSGPKDITGAAIAIGMVTTSLQAMLPPLDENASMFTKMAHSGLNLITTLTGVAFALQAFGIQLKAQSVMGFLGGKGIGSGGKQSVFNAVRGAGGSTNLAGKVTGVADSFAKLLGPLSLAIAAFMAFDSIFKGVAESVGDENSLPKKSSSFTRMLKSKSFKPRGTKSNRCSP